MSIRPSVPPWEALRIDVSSRCSSPTLSQGSTIEEDELDGPHTPIPPISRTGSSAKPSSAQKRMRLRSRTNLAHSAGRRKPIRPLKSKQHGYGSPTKSKPIPAFTAMTGSSSPVLPDDLPPLSPEDAIVEWIPPKRVKRPKSEANPFSRAAPPAIRPRNKPSSKPTKDISSTSPPTRQSRPHPPRKPMCFTSTPNSSPTQTIQESFNKQRKVRLSGTSKEFGIVISSDDECVPLRPQRAPSPMVLVHSELQDHPNCLPHSHIPRADDSDVDLSDFSLPPPPPPRPIRASLPKVRATSPRDEISVSDGCGTAEISQTNLVQPRPKTPEAETSFSPQHTEAMDQSPHEKPAEVSLSFRTPPLKSNPRSLSRFPSLPSVEKIKHLLARQQTPPFRPLSSNVRETTGFGRYKYSPLCSVTALPPTTPTTNPEPSSNSNVRPTDISMRVSSPRSALMDSKLLSPSPPDLLDHSSCNIPEGIQESSSEPELEPASQSLQRQLDEFLKGSLKNYDRGLVYELD